MVVLHSSGFLHLSSKRCWLKQIFSARKQAVGIGNSYKVTDRPQSEKGQRAPSNIHYVHPLPTLWLSVSGEGRHQWAWGERRGRSIDLSPCTALAASLLAELLQVVQCLRHAPRACFSDLPAMQAAAHCIGGFLTLPNEALQQHVERAWAILHIDGANDSKLAQEVQANWRPAFSFKCCIKFLKATLELVVKLCGRFC